MADPKKLHLKITAGPSYDTSTHRLVAVNSETPVELHSDDIDARVNVRIQNYRGLPTGSPSTSQYFSEAPHQSDLYSIAFNFTLKKSIPATDLLFGNDFEFPIKDKLPPGFNAALRIVKWGIDPGLDGDVYAEKPYLYGALASSINVLWVGGKKEDQSKQTVETTGSHLEEGGSESGKALRAEHKIPEGGAQRMKHFLTESHRKEWSFEAGREYRCDFFNPYLDFNDLALKLPGNFKLHLMSFWDGQPLRYTLKHRNQDASVDEVLFTVVISLIPEEQLEAEEQKLKEEKKAASSVEGHANSDAVDASKGETHPMSTGDHETKLEASQETGRRASRMGGAGAAASLGLGPGQKDMIGLGGGSAGGGEPDESGVD